MKICDLRTAKLAAFDIYNNWLIHQACFSKELLNINRHKDDKMAGSLERENE